MGLTSAFTYDSAPGKGVGQPATAATSTGAVANCGAFTWGSATWSAGAYARSFASDNPGRPSSVAITEDGVVETYALTYGSNGRVQTVSYPSGFVAKYAYTSLGYFSQITDNATGYVFWTANTRDAELHLTGQSRAAASLSRVKIISNKIALEGAILCSTANP